MERFLRRVVFLIAFSGYAILSTAQSLLEGFDPGAIAYLKEIAPNLNPGASLASQRWLDPGVSNVLDGGDWRAVLERARNSNPSQLNSLADRYQGYLSTDQRQQLEAFLNPDSDERENPGRGDLELQMEEDAVILPEEQETFEALPVDEEANVEPLFLGERSEQGYLPRFGAAEGRLNSNVEPFLFVPYVFQDGNFDYDTADLVLHPLYFDFRAVDVFAFYTDNALLSDTDKEEDVTIATNLEFSLVVLINDSFRLASGASLIYLPLTQEFGFSNLGGAGLRGGATGQTEAVYNIPMGAWDLRVYDTFSIQNYNYAGGRDSGFAVFRRRDGGSNGLANRSLVGVDGHNVALSQANLDALQAQRQQRFDADGTEFRNVLGAEMTRLLPGDTQLMLHGGRSDSWFKGLSFGLPGRTEQIGVTLTSLRENMRFKPSLTHNFFRSNIRDGTDRLTSLAFNGPLTDYVDLSVKVGQYTPGGLVGDAFLWGIELSHNPRPSLFHSFYIQRGAAGPNLDLTRELGWSLSWTVGPYTNLDFVVEQREFLDLDGDGSGSQEFRVGGILGQDLGTGLYGTFGVIYRQLDFQSALFGENEIWTTRFRVDKRLSDTLSIGLTYQIENWNSSLARGSFLENLVILNMTKQL